MLVTEDINKFKVGTLQNYTATQPNQKYEQKQLRINSFKLQRLYAVHIYLLCLVAWLGAQWDRNSRNKQ